MPKYLNKKITTNLHLYTPTLDDSKENTVINDEKGEVLFYGKPLFDDYWLQHIEYDPDYYAHFRYVMNRDGTLWYEANLYLINLIQYDTAYTEDQRITQSTIDSHSEALQKYKLFCDEQDEELDLIRNRNKSESNESPYWKVAKRPFSRPNIKYRDYLQQLINQKKIGHKYAKKILYPVIFSKSSD